MPAPPIRLLHDGLVWSARVSGSRVTFDDGASFVVREEFNGRFIVTGEDGAVRAISIADGPSIWIGVDGHAIKFRIEQADEQARSVAREDGALSPPMPATVVRIQVRPGDRVEAGDTLVLLEAMKMELPIRAERAAIVAAVHCEEGQMVQPGKMLVELE